MLCVLTVATQIKVMSMTTRCYGELIQRHAFDDRFEYLKLRGAVGRETFGFDRYMNQGFYASREWKRIRDEVIARDEGCDLGVKGYEIYDRLLIHHMNPMRVNDLTDFNPDVLDSEYLITTTQRTHNAIHFGDEKLLFRLPPERRPGDTKLW